MTAKLRQIGDDYLVALPADAVRQLAPDGPRDQMDVEVAIQDGQVVLRPCAEADSATVKRIVEKVMNDYDSTLRRLAK
jgi:hypothetical protein